jgi:DNA mismatch repair protein MSH6
LQTETPEGLARRNEERKRAGQKMQNVVNREKVAVLSKVG